MINTLYADASYYKNEYGGTMIPDGDVEKALRRASGHIDTLTYNRIIGMGILKLSGYQQQAIMECCCEMAEFEFENEDLINSVLQSYSVNGVNMSFGSSWNLSIKEGIYIRNDTYKKLQSTGLTCRVLR